jgi:Ca2+-binding RTX toxin-like protein
VDAASYAGSAAGVTVTLDSAAQTGGDAAGDALFAVEWLIGSGSGDRLTGNHVSNRLYGGAGNDMLSGLDGNDLLDGGAGNDMLVGGAGADRLLGGAGVDTASYAASAAGVTVTLDGPAGSGGDAAGDLLYYIEYLVGSGSGDRLTGNHVSNRLYGGAGDDSLFGAGGNDLLDGGAGSDLLDGGAGIDTVSYATATSRAFVNLQTSLATDPVFIEMDSLAGIENVIGSTLDDILVGEAVRTGWRAATATTCWSAAWAGTSFSAAPGRTWPAMRIRARA